MGKDGGVKRQDTTPVRATAIFEQIDAMPMRQQEMRSSRQKVTIKYKRVKVKRSDRYEAKRTYTSDRYQVVLDGSMLS